MADYLLVKFSLVTGSFHFKLTFPLEVTPTNIQVSFTSPETSKIVLPDIEDHTCIFIRLDKTPERDGQTDRQRSAIASTAVSHCKN